MVRGSKRELTKRRLQVARVNAGLSQLDVSLKLKIPERKYWQIENGYRVPDDAERAAIAKALHADAADLWPELTEAKAS